eukprot:g11293.t1
MPTKTLAKWPHCAMASSGEAGPDTHPPMGKSNKHVHFAKHVGTTAWLSRRNSFSFHEMQQMAFTVERALSVSPSKKRRHMFSSRPPAGPRLERSLSCRSSPEQPQQKQKGALVRALSCRSAPKQPPPQQQQQHSPFGVFELRHQPPGTQSSSIASLYRHPISTLTQSLLNRAPTSSSSPHTLPTARSRAHSSFASPPRPEARGKGGLTSCPSLSPTLASRSCPTSAPRSLSSSAPASLSPSPLAAAAAGRYSGVAQSRFPPPHGENNLPSALLTTTTTTTSSSPCSSRSSTPLRCSSPLGLLPSSPPWLSNEEPSRAEAEPPWQRAEAEADNTARDGIVLRRRRRQVQVEEPMLQPPEAAAIQEQEQEEEEEQEIEEEDEEEENEDEDEFGSPEWSSGVVLLFAATLLSGWLAGVSFELIGRNNQLIPGISHLVTCAQYLFNCVHLLLTTSWRAFLRVPRASRIEYAGMVLCNVGYAWLGNLAVESGGPSFFPIYLTLKAGSLAMSALLGKLFYGTRYSWGQVCGVAGMVAGMALVTQRKRSSQQHAQLHTAAAHSGVGKGDEMPDWVQHLKAKSICLFLRMPTASFNYLQVPVPVALMLSGMGCSTVLQILQEQVFKRCGQANGARKCSEDFLDELRFYQNVFSMPLFLWASRESLTHFISANWLFSLASPTEQREQPVACSVGQPVLMSVTSPLQTPQHLNLSASSGTWGGTMASLCSNVTANVPPQHMEMYLFLLLLAANIVLSYASQSLILKLLSRTGAMMVAINIALFRFLAVLFSAYWLNAPPYPPVSSLLGVILVPVGSLSYMLAGRWGSSCAPEEVSEDGGDEPGGDEPTSSVCSTTRQ